MKKITTNFIALSFLALFPLSGNATELLNNGNFETGNFSGWSIVSNSGTSGCGTNLWEVNSTGAQGCTLLTPTPAPTSGTYAAYNSFDGAGGASFLLSQTFALPNSLGSATLSFIDTYNMAFSNLALDRIFQIDIFDSTNTNLLANLFSFTPNHNTTIGWSTHSIDILSALSSLAGQTITLRLTNTVPEDYTGPAGFGIDDLSLNATSVPAPATLALMGLGLTGIGYSRKRKAKK